MKHEAEELKEARIKVAHFEKTTDAIKHEWDEYKEKYQKNAQDLTKKIMHLEGQKKIISDNLKSKTTELERIRAEAEQKLNGNEPSLKKQTSSSNLVSPQKTSSEDNSGLI